MKNKKNILCIALLVFSIIIFVIFLQYQRATSDKTAPKLYCETDTISADVSVTEEELLKGVTAWDNKDGDVTHTIVIQSISNFIKDNERIVTYAAIDNDMNVGTLERTLVYTNYQEPTFSLSSPLSYVVGSKINILANTSANSTLDDDISVKIRYGLGTVIDNLTPGSYPVEFRVTDSCGHTSYLNTEIEIFESKFSGIKVNLKDYLVYLPKGSDFDPEEYFLDSTIYGDLSIVNPVDTEVPGTYIVDYYVNAINTSGKSRLIVVVY